jgi:DNA-binding SARP family transcriptional activator/streptogramin lyase
VKFLVLGPIEASLDGRELEIGAGRQRALLALLLLHAGEVLSLDRIVEDLWGEQAPPSAAKVVQGYVSQLRRALAPDVIVTRGSGYVLHDAETDAVDFERLLERSRGEEPREAARTLRAALGLWRGRPYADVEYETWAQGEIGRLEELRLVTLEERVDLDIALGRHGEVVAELESLVAAHPLRERLRGLLMLALYRCDRQGEALEAYRDARSTLVEELGIEPSKALQRLEQAILRHDPELDAQARTPVVRPVERDHVPSGTVTFLSIDIEGSTELVGELRVGYGEVLEGFRRVVRDAVAGASGYEVDTQGDAFLLAFRSARDAVSAALAIQRALGSTLLPHETRLHARMGIHVGEPSVGAEGYHGIDVVRVSRICAAAHGDQILLSNAAKELAEGELPAGVTLRELGSYRLKSLERPERLYQLDVDTAQQDFPPLRHAVATDQPSTLRRLLRPSSRRGAAVLTAGVVLLAVAIGAGAYRLASGGSARVVVAQPNSVAAIDPASDAVVGAISVGNTPTGVAVGDGSVWVLNANDRSISRIDPEARAVQREIPAITGASDVAVSIGSLWVAGHTNLLSRVDPDRPLTSETLPLSAAGNPQPVSSAVAATSHAVWATATGAVWRIVPTPRRRIDVNQLDCCGTIAIGLGSVWVGDGSGIERLDASSGALQAHIKLPFEASDIAVGAGEIWVTDGATDLVWRIDPKLNAAGGTIQVGENPAGVTVGAGSVWVACADGTVSRIDPSDDRVVAAIPVGGTPQDVAVGFGRVWVSVD